MKVATVKEAWAKVNEIFPTDYVKDENRSQRAGYPVYSSTADNHFYDYICDLGNRLEINLSNGETINIDIDTQKNDDPFSEESVKALEAVKKLGRKLISDTRKFIKISLVVNGESYRSEIEKTVYAGLKRNENWLINELIENYCDANNIGEPVTDITIKHYDHGKGSDVGHYIIEGYIRINE